MGPENNFSTGEKFAGPFFFSPMMDTTSPLDLPAQLREVKRMLRGVMSGPVSASMRQQGLGYKINFGVDQPRLITLAREMDDFVTDAHALALALWKEDIRECRLLACIIMPPETFAEDMAAEWVLQLRYAEEAQALAMHLLSKVPYAADMAFRLIAAEIPLQRLLGWLVFGRLFAQHKAPAERDNDEILDHLTAELHDAASPLELRRTALNTLNKYMELGTREEAYGMRILQALQNP